MFAHQPASNQRELEVRVAEVVCSDGASAAQDNLFTCTKCGQFKLAEMFKRDRRKVSGRASICLSCNAAEAREWAKRNPDKVSARAERLTREQRDEQNAQKNLRYKIDPAYAQSAKERAASYYISNKDYVLARMSSDAGREKSRNRMRISMLDNGFRLSSNVSRAIRASIKDKGRRSWEEIVGYTLADLTTHIERQFVKGMSWDNHGKGKGRWHIDHIIPKAFFSFQSSDDDDFKSCWALTNLRPLWSELNISKHGKRTLLL